MADTFNDKKNFTSNESQDTIIRMWILFEGNTEPTKLKADVSKVTDLDDLKYKLTNDFNILKDVEPSKIIFFNHNDRSTPIPPDALLQPLADDTTAKSPLVVRYPISDSSIVVRFRFLQNLSDCRIPHSSGLWELLREEVREKFDRLATTDFIYIVKKNSNALNSSEEEIRNEYQLMNLISQTKPNELNERILNLKVRIKGKKAFGDWSFKEVAREIYNDNFDSLRTMRKFDIKDLPELSPPISEEEVKYFIKQLKKKASAFKNCVNTNEATVREYISIFMTEAVYHIQQYKDSTTTLSVESELEGSRGYGNLDYEVDVQDVPVLINEAKNLDMEKGVAQNLIQVHTAAEKLLGKRKREQVDSDSLLPPIMFGIVTTGNIWRFIRWSGTLQSPKAEISLAIVCDLCGGNYQDVKIVLLYIARLLQAQADALENNQDKERDNKRHKK
ncbi:11745_t:CDS:2 [Diversispora eburnea]|uniref:11745_t:CDS:1 n=1 Tax=Diversispora eburnea TaxID=1213867 RepID=A0A9N9GKK1_9GLOM|nr:11745_t:CDS:2 [Diversispora eburnea]